MEKEISNIEKMFQLFSSAAMNPKKYAKKNPPASVTVVLGPVEMEMLQVISARIGAPRASVAHHILKMGLYEAAWGCGFTTDDEGNIPEKEKNWDLTQKTQGVSFPSDEKEAE
jgi:hypothetical protein